MNPVPELQRFVVQIAGRHGINPLQTSYYLRLEQAGMMPLVIASHVADVLHVGIHNEFLEKFEPSVTLFTGAEEWAPLVVNGPMGERSVYTEFADGDSYMKHLAVAILLRPEGAKRVPKTRVPKTEAEAEAAEFCQNWARELQAQGWLQNGERIV